MEERHGAPSALRIICPAHSDPPDRFRTHKRRRLAHGRTACPAHPSRPVRRWRPASFLRWRPIGVRLEPDWKGSMLEKAVAFVRWRPCKAWAVRRCRGGGTNGRGACGTNCEDDGPWQFRGAVLSVGQVGLCGRPGSARPRGPAFRAVEAEPAVDRLPIRDLPSWRASGGSTVGTVQCGAQPNRSVMGQ